MPLYRLRFGRSASPHYPTAVALTAQIPGATVTGTGATIVHTIPLERAALSPLAELLPLVAGWKRTAVWRADQRLSAGAVFRLTTVITCWQEREQSGLAELHCQGWADGGPSAVPCRVLVRALPYAWEDTVPTDAVGARLIAGLAQRECVTACPAYDAAAVRAGMQAHLRALRRAAADGRRWATDSADDAWLARLLDDVEWGDET